MKRFYKDVSVVPAVGNGQSTYSVSLDGRSVKTPAKAALSLARESLAAAIAEEWAAQGEKIDPHSMPLTQLANTAIDRLPATRDEIVAEILGYADTDLVCYRTTEPDELVVRQTKRWDPVLDWSERRFGYRPVTTTDFVALRQVPAFHEALRPAVADVDDFSLAGLHLATGATGSVLLALMLVEAATDADAAYEAAMVDDIFQLDRWGEDAEARARLDRIQFDLDAVQRFVDLHRGHERTPGSRTG